MIVIMNMAIRKMIENLIDKENDDGEEYADNIFEELC